MVTISAKIFPHHLRKDGTFNVKICVCQKKEFKYFDTIHFVAPKQLTEDFKIKEKFILKIVESELLEYIPTISSIDGKLNSLSFQALKDYLENKGKAIDFISFSKEYIK
ncbi:hypothetical protein HDE70_000279 [Pedobacter cryoconitis]|nr:hypothetical protein [Pedobacter cryoconitis]